MPTFSSVYSNFGSFLPSVYKFGMVYTSVHKCFRTESTFLRKIFHKNDYPEKLFDMCFKKFLDNIHLIGENVPRAGKKRLLLVIPYLGIISLQTRTKLLQALKGLLREYSHITQSKFPPKLTPSTPLSTYIIKAGPPFLNT